MNETPAKKEKKQPGKGKGSQGGAKRLVKHSSIYATGNILRQLVGFIMLPVYTRYLTPADYGVVGLLLFAVSLIELVFGARMARAVPKFFYEQPEQDDRNAVLSTALLITASASGLAMFGVMFFRDPSSSILFGSIDYGFIVGIFATLILAHALENYGLQFIRLQQRPWLFISINLAKLVLQLSLNIWLVVFKDMGIMGVVWSTFISSAIFSSGLAAYTLINTGIRFRKEIASKMISFCWPLWVAGFAGLYIGSANRYYIRIFSSLEEVGFYELAVKFSAIITLLIWKPFSQYWQTERFQIYHENNPIPIYQEVFRFISTLMVTASLAVGIFADPVIRIMAAPAFHQAALAVPFLVIGAVFGSLTNYSNFSFLVKGKTGWMSQNEYVTAAIVTVFYLTLIPVFGFIGAAAALMLAQGVQFLVVHRRAKAHYDMQIPLTPLAINLIIVAAGLMVAHLVRNDDLIMDIFIRAIIFTLCAAAMMGIMLRDPGARQRVLALIPRRIRQATGL